MALSTTSTEQHPRLARLSSLLSDWQAHASRVHEAHVTGGLLGPITQFARLDQELGGSLAPGMHVLHGTPGAGKTAFALQVAATCGFPALVVSCEMPVLELFRRHAARATKTFLGRLKSGELSVEESLALAGKAAQAAPDLAFADATGAFASPTWLRDAALAVRGQASTVLIVIDSVHSWAEGADSDSAEYERLNAALGGLRQLASAVACPILAISERNRAAMNSGGLSASAGTRRFEYQAETVLDLTRDKDGPVDAAGEVDVTLALHKNRHGTAGIKVPLKFSGRLQTFREGK